MNQTYDDIAALPHHQSQRHAHMARRDRAAQFSPFAALTGYGEAVEETAQQCENMYAGVYDRSTAEIE